MKDLFDSEARCPFEVGDILQLKDGFDMGNMLSRVLVQHVEAASIGITAGLFRVDDTSPVSLPIAWIAIDDAVERYSIYKRKKL